jgi:hypothetical protein
MREISLMAPRERRSSGFGSSTASGDVRGQHLTYRLADAAAAVGDPNESLYRRLRERAGIEPHGGRRTLKAVAVEERLVEMLELAPGARWR